MVTEETLLVESTAVADVWAQMVAEQTYAWSTYTANERLLSTNVELSIHRRIYGRIIDTDMSAYTK